MLSDIKPSVFVNHFSRAFPITSPLNQLSACSLLPHSHQYDPANDPDPTFRHQPHHHHHSMRTG
jgi:hypothetical protein